MVFIEKYENILKTLFLLKGASEQAEKLLLESKEMQIKKYAKNEVIYSEANFEHCIGVILKGSANVYKSSVHMSRLGQGDAFGAITVYCERESFATTVKAATKCTVAFLPKSLVDALMESDVTVAKNYIVYLSERIYYLNGKIADFTKPTAQQRLEKYIADTGDTDLSEYTATELAKHLGIGRASLYRAMAQLNIKTRKE